MKSVFNLSTGADTGGALIRQAEAFAHEALLGHPHPAGPRWDLRSMVAATNYIEYPEDLPYSLTGPDGLYSQYDEADVVQLHSTLAGHHWYDEGQGKPTVLMHHGLHQGHFSQNLQEVIAEATSVGAVQIGSTVNLELYGPIRWMPIPYNVKQLADMRVRLFERDKDEIIRIGHAPTNRTVKSTDLVISTVKSLQTRGFPVKLVLIEHQTHAKTLEMKAKHVDIYVDQLKLGYGCNAIEAWAMGIPVIAGFSQYPAWREHAVKRYGCSSTSGLPFIEASEETLEARLVDLLTSRQMYDDWSLIGREHVLKWHDQKIGVSLLSQVYDAAAKLRTTASALATSRRHRRSLPRERRLALLRALRARNYQPEPPLANQTTPNSPKET